MTDTASIRLPRTGSIGVAKRRSVRTADARRRTSVESAVRSPRAAYAAGTYVVVDADYAARSAGSFTGAPTAGRASGTYVSDDAALGARADGSYVGR